MSATIACAFFGGQILVRERKVDVLGHGEIVEQVIALEDHADALAGEVGALFAVELVRRRFAEPVLAEPAVIEQARARSERRLPCAGWSHDGDELAFSMVRPMRRNTQVSVWPVL